MGPRLPGQRRGFSRGAPPWPLSLFPIARPRGPAANPVHCAVQRALTAFLPRTPPLEGSDQLAGVGKRVWELPRVLPLIVAHPAHLPVDAGVSGQALRSPKKQVDGARPRVPGTAARRPRRAFPRSSRPRTRPPSVAHGAAAAPGDGRRARHRLRVRSCRKGARRTWLHVGWAYLLRLAQLLGVSARLGDAHGAHGPHRHAPPTASLFPL